jgi:hypothetical protein
MNYSLIANLPLVQLSLPFKGRAGVGMGEIDINQKIRRIHL